MEDEAIIALYFARAERAILETGKKYGGYCRSIAFNILRSHEDAEECLSDTWLRTWNAIPPTRPACLRAFLGRITRNLSFSRWEAAHAQKRGGLRDALLKEGDCGMTTRDLFRCIGNLSDSIVEEAAEVRKKPRWIPIAALAACAVLAVCIPLAVRGMQKNAATADATAAQTPTMEAPAEDKEAADEATGSRGESSGSWYDSDPTAARILTAELGGLRLGMERENVQAMLGEPDSVSNAGETQREDGVWEVSWFYNTSGSADVQYDLRLRFTNPDMPDGSDWVLSAVWAQSPCDWTLDTGIGIGSPQEAVDSKYPDAVWTHEIMIENDQEIPYDLYELTSGDLFLLIRVEGGVVSQISFGGLNEYHFPDEEEPAPADPYTFTPYDTLSGGTVTAYSRTESGWDMQILTEKRAKRLVTAFNIMDPEPGGAQGEPVLWLKFASGGVAALYGESGACAVYRLEDEAAFDAAMDAGEDTSAALTQIGQYRFPDIWDDLTAVLAE